MSGSRNSRNSKTEQPINAPDEKKIPTISELLAKKNGNTVNLDKDDNYKLVSMQKTLEEEIERIAEKFGLSAQPVSLAAKVLRGEEVELAPIGSPILPKSVDWPTETYSEAHRNRGVNIVEFLEERYADLIRTGQVSRPKLREHDESAAKAVAAHLYAGKSFPSHLYIPTLKERNSAVLEQRATDVREARRLVRLADRRKADM